MKDMKNKEDGFDDGYDSDGEMGPFYNRTDREGPQQFNEDDDDDVGVVAECHWRWSTGCTCTNSFRWDEQNEFDSIKKWIEVKRATNIWYQI